MSIAPRPPRLALRAAALTVTLAAHPAFALDLVPTFDPAASEYPTFDNDASKLISLFNYAEDYYEDIFPDATTIPFRYYYEDLDDSLLGFAAVVSNSETGEILDRFIRIDTKKPNGTTRDWFIDPTPESDSEYDMGQILWRDPNNQATDWYNDFIGTTPQTFEVAYRGFAIGVDIDDDKDMLTAVLHEIGHYLLGASPGGGGEFPIPSNFIFNTTLSVETANTGGNDEPDDNTDTGHLESTRAMMNPGLPDGTRLRPSHTDLFAIAGNLGHDDIDVPRREFYGGTDWNNDANWSGDRTPDSNDDAIIRAAQGSSNPLTATLTVSDTVRNLTVAEGSNFRTDDKFLLIGEDLALTGTNTDVFIDPGGLIQAEQVTVSDNAELRINAGILFADDITIDATGHLIGNGTVDLDNAVAILNNNGRIAASGNATLTFDSDNTLAFDLDGSDGAGIVQAINGNLVFNSSLTDGFSSTMTVGPNRRIEFSGGAAFDGSALLLLDGSASADATVAAINITMQNNSVLRADGPGVVDASLTLQGSSTVEGASVSSSIDINGTLNLQGGNVVGDGLAVFNGDINVIQDAFFSITAVDLDGTTGNNEITINPNRELEITGIAIESTSGDGYDGIINVNSGTLTIHPNWRLDGDLNLNESDLTDPHLDGPGHLTIHTSGHLTITGDAEIDAQLTVNGQLDVGQIASPSGITEVDNLIEFNDTANVNIETGSYLDLNATTTYNGGTHTGFGTLRWNATTNIDGDTTINVLNLDWDGGGTTTTNIGIGHTLTINSSTLDTNPASPMDGIVNINSGHLHVLPAWHLNGQINMATFGFGTVTPTLSGTFGLTLNNGSEINITGDADLNTDIDSNGLIRTEGGVTTINGAITFNPSSDTVTFTPTFGFDPGNTIDLRGPTTYNAGTFLGNGIIRQNADATVVAPTTINVGSFDADGNTAALVTMNVDADLTINTEQIDEVEGIGKLDFNRYDGHFNVASGAALTVNLPPDRFWVAARQITLGDTGPAPAQLNGSEVWFGNSQTGAVNVSTHALAQINATSHFLSDVIVVIPIFGTDRLEINAPATFSGGVYGGGGMLAVNHDATINNDTTFSTTQIDLDGTSPGDHLLLINAGKQLTIENAINIDDDASHDDPIELQPDARLVVNTLNPWTLGPSGSFFLNQGHPSNISVSGQNLTSSGLIHGNGSFGIDLSNDGVIRPGLSTGHILVRHNYGQTTDGLLHLEIAGTKPATGHDQLEVIGDARLAGTVQAELIDGYVPDYGDRFTVLTAATVIGTFDTHLGLLIDTSLALAPIYSSDALTLRASVLGDLNFDNAVNVADLSIFALFFGSTQPFYDPVTDTNSWELGDFNADGAITVIDLSLLAVNFGFKLLTDGTVTAPSGLSVDAVASLADIDLAAVPEPATLTMLVVIALTPWRRPDRPSSCGSQYDRTIGIAKRS